MFLEGGGFPNQRDRKPLKCFFRWFKSLVLKMCEPGISQQIHLYYVIKHNK